MANEDRQEKKRLNFGQATANASLVAVIAAWVIRMAYTGSGATATLEQGKYYAEIVRMLLYGTGAVCAVIALFSMRKYGHKGIVLAALLGLLWNGAYFVRGGPKGLPALRAHARTVAENVEASYVAPPRQTPVPAAARPSAPAKQVIDYGAINFLEVEPVREAALQAASNESGEDALVLQAWADTLGLVSAARQKVGDAEKSLIAGDVLGTRGITSNQDFVKRRWLANDWAAAVHESEQALQVLTGRFSQKLHQRNVSPERVSVELDCLRKGIPAAAVDAARTIHGAEQAVATQFNYAISALETEWSVARDRNAFQPRADNPNWKERSEALSTVQTFLKEQRQRLGLPDPWAQHR